MSEKNGVLHQNMLPHKKKILKNCRKKYFYLELFWGTNMLPEKLRFTSMKGRPRALVKFRKLIEEKTYIYIYST